LEQNRSIDNPEVIYIKRKNLGRICNYCSGNIVLEGQKMAAEGKFFTQIDYLHGLRST
jgi:ribonuclease HIII